MRNALKKKLKQLSPSRTPLSENNSKSATPEKKKHEGYREKMLRRYKLTANEFEAAKKSAAQQEKDWAIYKKEQVLKIFEPKNTYVSKSAVSDLKHPKTARETKVQMKDGRTVEVEFGRMKEWYLYSLAPDKAFVDIRTQTTHEKELKPLREKQKVKYGNKPGKSQAAYDQIKSLHDATTGGGADDKTDKTDKSAALSPDDDESNDLNAINTTDEKRSLFPEPWYSFSMSRSQMEKGGETYWVKKNGAEEEEIDDDPDGKYTVTAEKVVETIEAGGKCPDSGVVEPEKDAARRMLMEPLEGIQERYKKTCSREIVYMNTLKGTIDFVNEKTSPNEETGTE